MKVEAADAGTAPLLVDLLHHASIEIAPDHARSVDILHDQFDPGTEVFVNFIPNGDYRPIIDTAQRLRRAGFSPVPHIAARSLASREALADFVVRLTGEAGVDRVLLVGGDHTPPLGPFASTMDILESGLLQRHDVKFVGIAGHPEGHPAIANGVLDAVLLDKQTAAVAAGLAVFIVTQFAFEARPILAWLERMRRAGVDAPVRVGVAGPATVGALVRFGLRCGIGTSLRTLRNRTNLVGGLLGEAGPEDLLRDLAVGLADVPDRAGVVGIHLFPFGGIARSGNFLARTLARLYQDMAPKAGGLPL
jgi:methylenetetrahydrofolate reductase (NADPH)